MAYKWEQWPKVDHKYHPPKGWQSIPLFYPSCRLNNPKNMNRAAYRTSVRLTANLYHWNSSGNHRWPLVRRRIIWLYRWRYSNRWDHNRLREGNGIVRNQSRVEHFRNHWIDLPKNPKLFRERERERETQFKLKLKLNESFRGYHLLMLRRVKRLASNLKS